MHSRLANASRRSQRIQRGLGKRQPSDSFLASSPSCWGLRVSRANAAARRFFACLMTQTASPTLVLGELGQFSTPCWLSDLTLPRSSLRCIHWCPAGRELLEWRLVRPGLSWPAVEWGPGILLSQGAFLGPVREDCRPTCFGGPKADPNEPLNSMDVEAPTGLRLAVRAEFLPEGRECALGQTRRRRGT